MGGPPVSPNPPDSTDDGLAKLASAVALLKHFMVGVRTVEKKGKPWLLDMQREVDDLDEEIIKELKFFVQLFNETEFNKELDEELKFFVQP